MVGYVIEARRAKAGPAPPPRQRKKRRLKAKLDRQVLEKEEDAARTAIYRTAGTVDHDDAYGQKIIQGRQSLTLKGNVVLLCSAGHTFAEARNTVAPLSVHADTKSVHFS